jgi:hypothetical protein
MVIMTLPGDKQNATKMSIPELGKKSSVTNDPSETTRFPRPLFTSFVWHQFLGPPRYPVFSSH